MQRYQVYLNPQSVSVLDEFEKIGDISRSKIIRQAVERIADILISVSGAKRKVPVSYSALDKLIGCIRFKSTKKTNYADVDDDIYLGD